VFADGRYNSAGHAEMLVLDQLESMHAQQDRSALTLYSSLQPCLMC
jgi:tRNA(Arg) A34 adenosine deaminase TadA